MSTRVLVDARVTGKRLRQPFERELADIVHTVDGLSMKHLPRKDQFRVCGDIAADNWPELAACLKNLRAEFL